MDPPEEKRVQDVERNKEEVEHGSHPKDLSDNDLSLLTYYPPPPRKTKQRHNMASRAETNVTVKRMSRSDRTVKKVSSTFSPLGFGESDDDQDRDYVVTGEESDEEEIVRMISRRRTSRPKRNQRRKVRSLRRRPCL